MIDRRTVEINLLCLRIGADQSIKITRFEFVRVFRERGEIAHAVVACAGFEAIVKRQRAQRRISAGAATAND